MTETAKVDKKPEVLKELVLKGGEQGDVLTVRCKVLDPRDTGNVIVAIGNHSFAVSKADLEAALQGGGSYKYYVIPPASPENPNPVKVETDRYGTPLA